VSAAVPTPHPEGQRPVALVKGAGDLATGVALRLHRAGFAVVMTEIAEPTVVRRTVAFAEAVFDGSATVEGVESFLARDAAHARSVLESGAVAVVVDPMAELRAKLRPSLLVDAIMAKRNLHTRLTDAPAVVALGPGFEAGRDVHAVIETKRGHMLGRVIMTGTALPNTGVPGEVGGYAAERVLRSPGDGVLRAVAAIGDRVHAGETVAFVDDQPVNATLDGILRGLLRPGLRVGEGLKLGDIDPRGSRENCYLASDKAMAIAGGVLEAACALLGGVRFKSGI
jgi:xanthine dehydrogenase accessory factor